MNEGVCEVAFDGGPEVLIHMVMRIRVGGCAGKLCFGESAWVRGDASVFVESCWYEERGCELVRELVWV
jgi:hypothetical protein